MIYLAVLTILMAAWGFCTGNVEGYKNEPGPTPQTPYHEFRSLQDGLVLLIIITGWAAALAGADFLGMLDVLVLSYGAQDGLYNRTLQRRATGSWNGALPGGGWWVWTHPTPLIDWLKLFALGALALISPFIKGDAMLVTIHSVAIAILITIILVMVFLPAIKAAIKRIEAAADRIIARIELREEGSRHGRYRGAEAACRCEGRYRTRGAGVPGGEG